MVRVMQPEFLILTAVILLVTCLPAAVSADFYHQWGRSFQPYSPIVRVQTYQEVETPVSVEELDYFTAGNDPHATYRLTRVEMDHFSEETFGWKFRSGFHVGAAAELQFILSYFPNHPKALSLMTTIATLWGKPLLPLKYFQKALQLFPQHALTHAQYGTYLVNIGMIEEGISSLKKALEMDPTLPSAHAALAKAYSQTKNAQLAREEARKARELGWKGQFSGID